MIESGSGGDVSGGEGERTLFNLCFIEAIEVISGFTFNPLSLFFWYVCIIQIHVPQSLIWPHSLSSGSLQSVAAKAIINIMLLLGMRKHTQEEAINGFILGARM